MLEHNSLPPANADAGRTETHDIYQSSASADRMADRSRPTKIGFIGLGLMGSADAPTPVRPSIASVAVRLSKHWDRSSWLERTPSRQIASSYWETC